MSTTNLFRGVPGGLLATLLVASCGGGSNQPDPYQGVIFTTDGTNPAQIDSKFLAQTCTASASGPACRSSATKYACATGIYNCYVPQQGYANGAAISFYNMVSLTTGVVPTKNCNLSATVTKCPTGTIQLQIPVSALTPTENGGGGANAYLFPRSCSPGRTFNPATDAYTTATQFTIFDNLPFSLTSNQVLDGAFDYPIVAQYSVNLTGTETCNDLKDDRSILAGDFGASRSSLPKSYQLWAPIDVTSQVVPLPDPYAAFAPQFGWYRGLLLRYFDGGQVPVSDDGKTFLAMDGVIVDPAGTSFSDVTDPKVILLPAVPGDQQYSPIVHLHDYHLQSGQSIGSVTSICTQEPCPASSADYSKVTAAPFYTIFIAAPQQAQ